MFLGVGVHAFWADEGVGVVHRERERRDLLRYFGGCCPLNDQREVAVPQTQRTAREWSVLQSGTVDAMFGVMGWEVAV